MLIDQLNELYHLFGSDSLDSGLLTWVIVPLLIFAARVLDVTLMTMRIIFVSRGKRFIAPLVGFFEVLIWLLAIRQIMQNLDNPATYIAYAAGFATGNIVGMVLEDKLALGMLIIRIITIKEAGDMAANLHMAGYGVTSLEAQGATGPAHLIFTVIKRKNLPQAIGIIKRCNPKAFISVEEIRSASEGVFPSERSPAGKYLSLFNFRQKRK